MSNPLTEDEEELLERYKQVKDQLIVQGDRDHNLAGFFTLEEFMRLSLLMKKDGINQP